MATESGWHSTFATRNHFSINFQPVFDFGRLQIKSSLVPNYALQQTVPGVTPLAGFAWRTQFRAVAGKGRATGPAAERGR